MSLTQFLHFRNMSHLVTEKKLFFLQKKSFRIEINQYICVWINLKFSNLVKNVKLSFQNG